MPKISSNRIVFDRDDFLAGLSENYGTSLTTTPAVLSGNKLALTTKFNPYRTMGYASPGYNPVDATDISAVNTIVKNGVVSYESSTAYAYLISGGVKFHQLTPSSNTISNAGVWPHTITGVGAITGSDVIAYRVGATNYIWYSFQDSTSGWNVGRYSLDGATFDDDYMSTVPAGTAFTFTSTTNPIPMIVGSDDILYIGNGNLLNAFDGQTGASGTRYPAVLTLPSGYRITCFARTDTYLVVFAYLENRASSSSISLTRTTAKAFFWDYLSLDPTYTYDLDDNTVTEAVNYKGTIACFTEGRQAVWDGQNRFSHLKVFDGTIFETVASFIGNAPFHGGAESLDDVIQWCADGVVYQWGPPYKDLPFGLFRTAEGASTGSSSNSGMCKTFDSSGTYFSSGGSAGDGLMRMVSNYATGANISTSIADPEFPYGKIGRVKSVTVLFGKTASGGRSLAIDLIDSANGTAQVDTDITTITAANMHRKYEVTADGTPFPTFQDLRLNLIWSSGSGATDAPRVRRVVVDYELTNIENP